LRVFGAGKQGLCDQDTGWYYQFGATIKKAEYAILKAEREEPGGQAPA
jgi:hypothetical protein